MSDLFGEGLTNEQIAAVFGVMASAQQHTYQILTKRADRMLEWFKWIAEEGEELEASVGATPPPTSSATGSACVAHAGEEVLGAKASIAAYSRAPWPLPNVWLGVSVERQGEADERIPLLLQCPAAVRWVSAEPLLGPVDLRRLLHKPDCQSQFAGKVPGAACTCGRGEGLDWIVTGGESGYGARPCDMQWIRDIGEQCRAAGVAWFNKQIGAFPTESLLTMPCKYVRLDGARYRAVLRDKKGADPAEWPADLRVREWPAGFTPLPSKAPSKALPMVTS